MPIEGYFDPAGETEPNTTRYTLIVYKPPRPPPRWLPDFITRKPVTHPNQGATYKIQPDNTNPLLDCFERKHLDELDTKAIVIKSAWFPADMRCTHVAGANYECREGCYFLEKGGDVVEGWKCKRDDCEGHVYRGRVQRDADGRVCFGKKGERMVCIQV